MDLVIENALVFTGGRLVPADVGVAQGRVAALGRIEGPASERLDAAGLWLLPGAVDAHFHCRTPGHEERGDFASETRAAAAGGTTTILEMPISKPGCATPAIFRDRRALIEQQAIIDVGLYGAPGTLIREDVLGMAAEGAVAFKIFMHRAPLGREDEFIGICLPEDEQLYQALKLTKETGLRLVAHCESDSMLEAGIERLRATGRHDFAAHGESRPGVVEAVAVARLLTLAEDVGAPVHVAHVTCEQALRIIRRFRRDGLDVTAETCPHYLFFDEDEVRAHGAFAKINPPIRSSRDRTALWAALADGTLDLVTTDHAPYVLEEKQRDSIWRTPAGAPGAQALLPSMLSAALEGGLPLARAIELIAEGPARTFGLEGRKGAIALGADADFCLFDPQARTRFTRNQMHSKAAEVDRIYLDTEFQGRVVATLSRGRVVFRDGQILAESGSGRFLSATTR